jgi:nicotinate dehydrogenase subunit B
MNHIVPTRREFTAGLGSIIVSFSLDPKPAFAQQAAKLPGSLAENRMLDAWIRINADGSATIFPGKVELGQGITTALTQIAAEELDVLTTDTTRSPNEGVTSGSQSIEYGGTALRLAGAEVRASLLDLAAKRLGVAADMLTIADGTI